MSEDLNAATPSTPPSASGELYKRVDEVLDRIRPYVQSDGGHVELVNVDEAEGTAFIRFQGACSGCPSSAITLQMGIENEIRTSVPEIRQVVAV
jgi:Fe-S cluster biogenesis protein NfuA